MKKHGETMNKKLITIDAESVTVDNPAETPVSPLSTIIIAVIVLGLLLAYFSGAFGGGNVQAKGKAAPLMPTNILQSLATPTLAPSATPVQATATQTRHPTMTPLPTYTASPTADVFATATAWALDQERQERQNKIDKEYYTNLGLFIGFLVVMVVVCAFVMFLLVNWGIDSTRRAIDSLKRKPAATMAPQGNQTAQDAPETSSPFDTSFILDFLTEYAECKTLAASYWENSEFSKTNGQGRIRAFFYWLETRMGYIERDTANKRVWTKAGQEWVSKSLSPTE